MRLIVMTFGATALQDTDSLLTISEVLRQTQQAGDAVIAVIDALPGVMPLLQQSIDLGNYSRTFNKLQSIHSNIARKLVREASDRTLLIQDIGDILGTYQWLGKSIINRNATPAEAATMMAIGARLSAHLLAASLQHRGVRTSVFNSHDLLTGDDQPLSADQIEPMLNDGTIIIVGSTGAGGKSHEAPQPADSGVYWTAGLIAAASQANSLWLMQRDDGILTGSQEYLLHPQTVPALPLTTLSEMVNYGAPMPPVNALQSAIDAHIPMSVRSIFQPSHPGTYIQPQPSAEAVDFGPIVVQKQVGTLHIGKLEPEAGLRTLQDNNIPAIMNHNDMTFFVNQQHLTSAYAVLSQSSAEVVETQRESDSLVSVLGSAPDHWDELRHALQTILQHVGITAPILKTSAGQSGNLNLSVLIPAENVPAAVNAIHDRLFNK